MNELIRFFLNNPILLLVVVVWIFSGIASAAAKNKRVQEQRRRQLGRQEQRQQRAEPWERGLQAQEPEHPRAHELQERAEAAPTSPPRPTSAEEIARQLREMLGLETEAPPPPPRPPVEVHPVEVVVDEERVRHREPDRGDSELPAGVAGKMGELHQEIAERRQRQAAAAALRNVARGRKPAVKVQPVRVRRRPLRFERQAAAAAIVALEVLGPPRALRPHEPPV